MRLDRIKDKALAWYLNIRVKRHPYYILWLLVIGVSVHIVWGIMPGLEEAGKAKYQTWEEQRYRQPRTQQESAELATGAGGGTETAQGRENRLQTSSVPRSGPYTGLKPPQERSFLSKPACVCLFTHVPIFLLRDTLLVSWFSISLWKVIFCKAVQARALSLASGLAARIQHSRCRSLNSISGWN